MTKEGILKEVQRLAALGGGKSPGMRKFHKETGITYDDWFGKYWARWSDLLHDAGLESNQMQAAYQDEFLIEKLIVLIREIGRYPVKGDFLMKKYKEKEFPSEKTFTRLGARRQLISKTLEYCNKNNGYEDVIRICQAALPDTDEIELPKEAESLEKIGLVYLIKSGRFYKIGRTASIGRRVYDLAIQLAEEPTIVHIIKTDDPEGIEKYWHMRFAGKRKGGEWFNLDAADIKAFKRWLRIV